MTIGAPERLSGTVRLSGYDPAWPAAYRRESARIRAALPARVLRLEHVGSTSIPGLPAKPIIDIVLEVPDSSAEPAYASSLEAAGYVLRIREPEWFEHRLFNSPDAEVNLHVFSDRCPETDRMVLFRDRLRSSTADRDLYARSKQASASRRWAHVQQYADAKTEVITTILSRAHGAPGD